MHVALLTDGIWPYVLGGMQKHAFYVCKYLAQQQIKVDLFHFNQSDYDILKLEFFSEAEREYIHAVIVDFPTSKPFPGHYIYNSYRYSKDVFEAMKDRLPMYDFIYTKGFAGWHLMKQKQSGNIRCAPIAVKFHGYEMFQKPPDIKIKLQHWLLLRKPVRDISLMADVVFSYGGKITDIIRTLGVPEQKIFELPSGVEESALAQTIVPSSATRKFLFLGRYERRKGIEELNEAIQQIVASDKFQQSEFQFIGPIPVDKQLKLDRVTYHGEIRSKEGLQLLIRKCDVLICPSWSEGMPNVILEAMANGLSVIATDVGATNVLVNEKTGWLLQDSDPVLIQRAIENASLISSEELARKKQAAHSMLQNHFTWEKLINRLTGFLKTQP